MSAHSWLLAFSHIRISPVDRSRCTHTCMVLQSHFEFIIWFKSHTEPKSQETDRRYLIEIYFSCDWGSGRCSHCLHCFNFIMKLLRLSIIEWSAIVCDRTNLKSRFFSYCQLAVHETDTVFVAVCEWHGADHGAPLHTRTSYTALKHMQSFSARSKSKLSHCCLASGAGIACSRALHVMKKSQSRNYPPSTHSAQFRWKLKDFSLVFFSLLKY